MGLGGEFVSKAFKNNMLMKSTNHTVNGKNLRNYGVTLPSVKRGNSHHSFFFYLSPFQPMPSKPNESQTGIPRIERKKKKNQTDLCCLPCSLGMKV